MCEESLAAVNVLRNPLLSFIVDIQRELCGYGT